MVSPSPRELPINWSNKMNSQHGQKKMNSQFIKAIKRQLNAINQSEVLLEIQ